MSEDMSRRGFLEMAAAISVGTTSSFGQVVAAGELGVPADKVTVLRSKNPKGGSWPDIVARALASPLGAPKLGSNNLRGKRIVVMTDDWGRPTPASEFIPVVLEELHAAGAEDANITFITASGMHVPMTQEERERKLGKDIVAKFRTISHDAGDWNMLAFVGTSDLGTPIWVNRYVAEADFKVALGRIAPHEAYGYEGGFKMIVPGVSSFETILRDHSMNFSQHCVPGVHTNPSRREADSIGAKVGINFVVNIVVNRQNEPVRAFAGKVETVHPQGIQFGDKEVWGAVAPCQGGVTVLTLGPGESLREELPSEMLRRAATVTTETGTIICESKADRVFKVKFGDGVADEETLNSKDVASFNAMLPKLSLSEIMRIHEMRDWKLDRRTIQHRVKAIRSRYYLMRNLIPLETRHVLLTPNPTATFKSVMAKLPKDGLHVNVLVGGTVPKVQPA